MMLVILGDDYIVTVKVVVVSIGREGGNDGNRGCGSGCGRGIVISAWRLVKEW